MPKIVLFLLKNIVKIAKRWGLCPQTSLLPTVEGFALNSPTSVMLHCEFSLHLSTKHSLFRNQPKDLIFL